MLKLGGGATKHPREGSFPPMPAVRPGLDDPSGQEVKEQFNASVPSEDLECFAKLIADFAEKMTTYAGSAGEPGEYGKLIAARLCPNTLPYELGTSAAFEVVASMGARSATMRWM